MVYLERVVNMCQDIDADISRKIRSWSKIFTTIKDVTETKLDNTIHSNPFNSAVLPVITRETWATKKKEVYNTGIFILRISLHEHIWSQIIREWSGMKNVIAECQKQKFCWAGQIARITDNRLTRTVAEWYLKDWKYLLGWPTRRRKNEIAKWFASTWRKRARSRRK